MLKWYLRIYIFIEYLNVFGKVFVSGLFEMIQKKKKSEDCVPRSEFGLRVESDMAVQAVIEEHNQMRISAD